MVKVLVLMLDEYASMLKEIIQHPNTPAYIQALIIFIAAWWGHSYLKKRKTEYKFELIVKTYKYCLEAHDILIRLKQPPIYFKSLDDVEGHLQISEKNFVTIVGKVVEHYLGILNKERELFDKLYECYVEMRLFFNKRKEVIQPIGALLNARNRISELLETTLSCTEQMNTLTSQGRESALKIIRNGMVQLWECIDTTEWQKQMEEEEGEKDGKKWTVRFYYLDKIIKDAKVDIDESFPELIKNRTINRAN